MVNYDDENGEDQANINQKDVTLAYDPEDLEFWFSQLENKMEWAGIRSQWTKRQALTRNLPPEIMAEVKGLLKKNKTAAGNTCYKDVKTKLLSLFGPKKEEAYYKAAKLVLVGKPSQLANKIITLLCPADPPLQGGCHCETSVSGMWREQLPREVRTAVANMQLGGGHLEATLAHADAVYEASRATNATVAGLKESADGHVDAFGQQSRGNGQQGQQGQGKKNRGNGGQSGNKQNQNQQKGSEDKQQLPRLTGHKGQKHPDNPPDGVCYSHYKHGKTAINCLRPQKCAWRSFVAKESDN